MSVIHIVLFKFRSHISSTHKESFIQALKQLRNLSCVLDKRLFVGSPSITTPIEKSKGYEIALVSFHRDRRALAEYQGSEGHKKVTGQWLWGFEEDVVRFDFEVEGVEMGEGVVRGFVGGEVQ